jgi:ketosteroid isomerase-like protein
VSERKSVVRKAIPLCGIVLVLGTIACGRSDLAVGGRALFLNTQAQNESQARSNDQELIATVQEFLAKVPENRRSTFDRFFADDVIYTRGTGQVITKKDILADTGNSTVPRANATFSGEDFNVHQYGDMAIVNFRLVMDATDEGKPVTRSFRNTGTFMKRNGQWQAVAWQATPIAEPKY